MTGPDVRVWRRRESPLALAALCTLVLVFLETTSTCCRRPDARLGRLVRGSRGQPLRVVGDRDPATVRDHLRQHGWRFVATRDVDRLRPLPTTRRTVPMTCVLDLARRARPA